VVLRDLERLGERPQGLAFGPLSSGHHVFT
jgi:hypothetical protein